MEYLDQRMTELFLDVRADPLAYRVDYRSPVRPRHRQGGWLARSTRQMLARLGGALVALGRRLEQYDRLQRRPDLTIG
jgi:hypothetical protein